MAKKTVTQKRTNGRTTWIVWSSAKDGPPQQAESFDAAAELIRRKHRNAEIELLPGRDCPCSRCKDIPDVADVWSKGKTGLDPVAVIRQY